MISNPTKNYIDNSLEIATLKLAIESKFRFYIQNEILNRAQCNFKEAQLATEKLLSKALRYLDLKDKEIDQKHIHNLITLEVKQLKISMSKNFGLTESQFNQLAKRLRSGDHTLFKETFLAHFNDCMKYLMNKYGASYDDAYDISMDTLITFRTRIVEGKVKYGNIRFLFTQMASQHYQRKIKRTESLDKMNIDVQEDVPEIDLESIDILNKAWDQLGESCRQLLKKVFYGQMKLKDIAIEENRSGVAIRKQKERCISKLKILFQKITKSY